MTDQKPLTAFANWAAQLDDPDNPEYRTVTLRDIAERAQQATLDAERAARDGGGLDAVRGAIGALHSAVESGEPCSALLHRVYTEGVAACAALSSPARPGAGG